MILSGSVVQVNGLGCWFGLRDEAVDGGLKIDHATEDTAL
jgi:hypothetical protein